MINNVCFNNNYWPVITVRELGLLEMLHRKTPEIHRLKTVKSGKDWMMKPGGYFMWPVLYHDYCTELPVPYNDNKKEISIAEREKKYKDDETKNICK